MPDQPQKLDLKSMDITEEKKQQFKQLFPEVFREDEIDFDHLKRVLSKEWDVDSGGKERFGLQWPGKAECMKIVQQPSIATLTPDREESVNFDETENLFIEGDNLEVLKLLQKSYFGKVKMIYIDPPYNTGNEFIYPDDYGESLDTYLKYTGQKDEEGNWQTTNRDTDGRFHSRWLNMMYPRLFLAKNLLKNDGVIFISIDDRELPNLRKLCDEIFGEENLLASFVWRTEGNFDNQAKVKKCHEYILAYCKNVEDFPHPPVIDPSVKADSKLYNDEIRNTIVKNGPKNPVSEVTLPEGFPASFKVGTVDKRTDRWPHYLQEATIENGILVDDVSVKSGWSSKELLEKFIDNDFKEIADSKGQETKFEISSTGAIEVVKKRKEDQSHVISVLSKVGSTQSNSLMLEDYGIYFDYPKPIELLKYLIQMNDSEDFIILDLFSGSCSTAHSILKQNNEDGGSRKFIMVQLPELLDKDSTARQAGYQNVADIGKERIRKVINEIQSKNESETNQKKLELEEKPKDQEDLDLGFKVFKLQQSNFKVWDSPDVDVDPNELEEQLDVFADHITPEAEQENILYELILKSGYPLTTPISKKEIDGKPVYSIQDDALLIYLDEGLTFEILEQMAEMEPERVVCLDQSFTGDEADALKTNAVQLFEKQDIAFRTV